MIDFGVLISNWILRLHFHIEYFYYITHAVSLSLLNFLRQTSKILAFFFCEGFVKHLPWHIIMVKKKIDNIKRRT